MRRGDMFMQSRPVEIYFAGWRATTAELGSAGWKISAEQDFDRQRMTIALRNEAGNLTLLTETRDWPIGLGGSGFARSDALPVMRVVAHGTDIRIQTAFASSINYNPGKPYNFEPVDWRQQITEVHTINDLAHFAPLKQIILPEATVPNLLERILELQQPGMEEHYMKLAREKVQARPVGQIIGVAA